jgi:hypothetical protein
MVRETGRFIYRGHQALRRDELSTALGVDAGSVDRTTVEREMAQARRCAAALSAEVGRARHGTGFAEADTWLGENRDEAYAALGSARETFIGALRESDLPAGDALESLDIWDSAVSTLRERGIQGLVDEMLARCNELRIALRPDEDWGRKPHSPIETWQWIVIAAILLIAVALVIVCLIWFGCSWFYYIFVGACFATGAFGGWAGLCAGFGF